MAGSAAATRTKDFACFELLERLGHGGMAVVFRAKRLGRGEEVAVKIVSRRIAEDAEVAARFRHECEFACTVDHPHLVRALEYGVCDKMPYLVMEYVPGLSLSAMIRAGGPLPEAKAVSLIAQMAEALGYLHSHHIVHRDVKPENILVTPAGSAKMIDYGLLKDLEAPGRLTKTRTGLGTDEYAAPEQFQDARDVDPRSDIYSLAATLYVALTGAFPFGSGGHLKVLRRKLDNEFEAPDRLVSRLSPEVNETVCRCLNADRGVRPATAREFLALLQGEVSAAAYPAACRGKPRPQPSGAERRVTVRHEIDLESSCEMALNPQPGAWAAVVQDVSLSGLCVRAKRRFEAGTTLRVTLRGLPEQMSYLARVCWVKEHEGRQWLHGCALHPPLSQSELDTICFEGRGKTKLAHAR